MASESPGAESVGRAGGAVLPAPAVLSRGEVGGAIRRGIQFLARTQCSSGAEGEDRRAWEGSWPLRVRSSRVGLSCSIPDLASGPVALVHRSLARAAEIGGASRALSAEDAEVARRLRLGAARMLRRFAVRDVETGATCFGWWPTASPGRPSMWGAVGGWVVESLLGGPRHHGALAPVATACFPRSFRLWPDVDDTAMVHDALLDDARLDGGTPPEPTLPRLLARARDLHAEPLRFPAWRTHPTGAFLTWLLPASARGAENDLDLVVNANALRALARAGHRDAPGVRGAVDLIHAAVLRRRHDPVEHVSPYYPEGPTFAFFVTLAACEGPVPALDPTAARLADELEAEARPAPRGAVEWGAEDGPFATAAAMVALRLMGRADDLVAKGARHLLRTQRPDGGWPEAAVCGSETLRGFRLTWRSRALPSALAVEALVRAVAADLA